MSAQSFTTLSEESKLNLHSRILSCCGKPSELFYQFVSVYLHTIADHVLKQQTLDQWVSFLTYRYNYFCTADLKKGAYQLIPHPDSTKDQFILEFVFPDAPFLLISVEALLAEFNASITKLYHPIMQLSFDSKKKIKKIALPKINTPLFSIIYIEFESNLTQKTQDLFLNRLSSLYLATQQSHVNSSLIDKEITTVQKAVSKHPSPLEDFHQEWVDLFDWLKDHNFSFFGYGQFSINSQKKDEKVTFKSSSGLGLLHPSCIKSFPELLDVLQAHSWRLRHYRSPFLFDTIKFNSPIQRFEHLMRLSLKIPTKTGFIEHNFLGLLKRSSLLVKNIETPIIRLKMSKIIEKRHLIPGSYDFNQFIRFLTAIPKFELFRTPANALLETIEDLLSITNPNEIYCFSRQKIDPSQLFIMIVIPPKLFQDTQTQKIKQFLIDHVPHQDVECIHVQSDALCRLHFHFDQPQHHDWMPNCNYIENHIRHLIKNWADRLLMALLDEFPQKQARQLFHAYVECFPHHHQVRRTPEETVRDIKNIEYMLHANTIQFDLVPFIYDDSLLSGKVSILYIYNKDKIDLISIMPILENMGIHVYDELTTRIGIKSDTLGYIHAFRIAHDDGQKINESVFRDLLVDLLQAYFNGFTENDTLNALILKCQFSWKQVNVLIAYRNLYCQLGAPYSKQSINNALIKHLSSTKLLFSYFETAFSLNPSFGDKTYRLEETLPKIDRDFFETLHHVDTISEDVILKRLFNLIKHTLRTNFYISKSQSESFISLKIESSKIQQMPSPAPYREIFVYDVAFEGIHLRFGPASRGGIRWSNRPEDFRKEVLELAKTQQSKNVVIVPVGSKGGFVLKNIPSHSKDLVSLAKTQYERFISGLLDVTDSLDREGQIIHPQDVLFYDEPDPYLVVAADKGTASFSDYANAVSNQYKFWLGDAFASGGSMGYNHKEVGITAKGAWECVKLHFQEMGKDIQKTSFTVIGIGDMSGDVFGNGMLLSQHIELVAAFNHLHIFIDPNPDTKKSWKERRRLFKKEQSTWKEYNAGLISKGGGIFDRKSKEIHISNEMKALFNIKEDVLNGEQLIHKILQAKVELLWFGGIGTYIKSSQESHLKVGDPSNDYIRIDVRQCHFKVIGEGANLGITSLARLELGLKGVLLNTDFIDNSAGVNMSDYEVNLKILCKLLIDSKKIKSLKARNTLLKEAENQVTDLVLSNNRAKHRLLSMDMIRSKVSFDLFYHLHHFMVDRKIIDPKTEVLLTNEKLRELGHSKQSLPRPYLAVLQAYVKMMVFDALVDDLKQCTYDLSDYYVSYFPPLFKSSFQDSFNQHHLKTEILATVLSNRIVNQAGSIFFYRVQNLSNASLSSIAYSYLYFEQVTGCHLLRDKILNTDLSLDDQYHLILVIEDALFRLVIDQLHHGHTLHFDKIASLKTQFKAFSQASSNTKFIHSWQKKRVPESLAKALSSLTNIHFFTDILLLKKPLSMPQGLDLLSYVDQLYGFDWLNDQLTHLQLNSQWEYHQQELLYQHLRQEKNKLILSYLNDQKIKSRSFSKASFNKYIESHYGPALLNFSQLLATLKLSKVGLTELSVAIFSLKF